MSKTRFDRFVAETAVPKMAKVAPAPEPAPAPAPDTRSVAEKIQSGEYGTKLPLPDRKDSNYLALRKARLVDITRLHHQLKADLLAESSLTGHPKADLLWDKVWDHAHSGGLREVLDYFEDLAELLY